MRRSRRSRLTCGTMNRGEKRGNCAALISGEPFLRLFAGQSSVGALASDGVHHARSYSVTPPTCDDWLVRPDSRLRERGYSVALRALNSRGWRCCCSGSICEVTPEGACYPIATKLIAVRSDDD
jgi:hypothetical protein